MRSASDPGTAPSPADMSVIEPATNPTGKDPAQVSASTSASGSRSGVWVETAETLAELARHRDFQLQHQWHPESSYDLLHAALSAREDGSKPYSLVLWRDGVPEAMLVGQVVPAVMPWTVGYKVVRKSPLRLLEVLHGGIIGNLSPANVRELYDAVRVFLRGGGADAVYLRNIRVDSEVYRAFQGQTGWLRRDGAARRSLNWKMPVPASYEAYRKGLKKRSREDLRRYEKRMTKEFGDEVSVVRMDKPADIVGAMLVTDEIAAKTYQRGIGAGFLPTREARARWGCAAEKGWLRLYVLYLGGKPAAFCSGFALGETLWLEHIGFDPDLRACQPGGFLLQRVLEATADEGQQQVLDFGVGDADYKRRLCSESHEETAIYVFAPSVKGLWLSSMRRTTNMIGAAGRWSFERLGVLDRLKSHWRRRIASRQKSD